MAYRIGNYALVANGIDNSPESMQDMLIPFAYHTQQYDKAMGEYDQLYDKANAFSYLKDLPEGSRAKQIFNTYVNDLQNASKGLDEGYIARDALSRMKRRYSGEIGQLDMAVKNRQEDMTLMMKQHASDPTTLFEKNGVDDIDTYLDGQRHYGRTYSGAQLAKEASEAVKGLSQRLSSYDVKQIDDYTNALITKYGIDPGAVAQYVQNPTANNQQRLLATIEEGILDTSGIKSWGNPEVERRARGFIANAMWGAVGKSQMQPFDNYAAKQNLQLQNDAIRAGWKGGNNGDDNGGLHANPVPLRSQQEISENNKRLEDAVKNGYIQKMPNGTYNVTSKGIVAINGSAPYQFDNRAQTLISQNAYSDLRKTVNDNHYQLNKKTITWLAQNSTDSKVKSQAKSMLSAAGNGLVASDQSVSPARNRQRQQDYDFGSWWLNNVGDATRDNKTGKYVVNTPNTNLRNWVNNNSEGSYDTWHSTGWDVQLSDSYGKEIGKQMIRWAPNNELTVAEFDGGNGWKQGGKKIKTSDLKGFVPGGIVATRWGNAVTFVKDGDEPITVLMPNGINPTAQANLLAVTQMASDLAEVENQKYKPVTDAYGNIQKDKDGNIVYDKSNELTDLDKVWIDGRINKLQDLIYWHAHHIVVPEKTEEEKITSGY